jgi:hypothetical protein
MVSRRLVRPVPSRAAGGELAVDEPLQPGCGQDGSGVHEAAMRAIAAVTRETPDTSAVAALA